MRKVVVSKEITPLKGDVASASVAVKTKTHSDASIVRIRDLLEHCDALEREIQINAEKYKTEIARLKKMAGSQSAREVVGITATPDENDADHQFPDYKASVTGSQAEREALLQTARKFAQDSDWDKAATAYRKLIQQAPNQAGVWKQYGHALKESGRLGLAEKAYYRALSLRSGDADVTQHLGDLLIRMGKTEEARFILSGGNQLAPSNADIARALSSLGGVPVEAISAHAVKTQPLGFFEKRRLKKILAQAQQAAHAKRWAEAEALYQELSKLVPSENKYIVQMGHACKEAGKYESAEQAYRLVISREPLNSDAYLHLGHVLKLQGRGPESREAYEMALRCWPYNRDALDEI